MSKRVYVTLDDDLYEVINREATRRRLAMAAVMRDVLAGHYQEELKKLAEETRPQLTHPNNHQNS
jgi:hypothetical protein